MGLFFSLIVMLFVADVAHCQNPWVSLEKPTSKDLMRVCFIDTSRGWTVGDSGTILKTTNGGHSWTSQHSGIINPIHCLFMLNQSFGWALAFQEQVDTSWYGTTLLATTNGGATWTRRDFVETFYYAVVFLDSMNGLLGGTGGKIVRTSDGGVTWEPTRVDSTLHAFFPVRHFKFFSGDYGFAFGGQLDITGVVWRTMDGGRKWQAVNASNEPIHGFHYVDSLHILALSGDYDAGSNMSRSGDAGQTWDYVYLGIWGEARALSFRTPREGWCPLGFAGTYMVTSDTGRTWRAFPSQNNASMYDAVFIDSTHGFMVGSNGTILAYDPSATGVDERGMAVPVSHVLHQNFPNPFNPVTVIPYELAEGSTVTVTVYDVSGKKVKTLFQGHMERGIHETPFDGAGLASGTYFYELTTANGRSRSTQMRKMILLR